MSRPSALSVNAVMKKNERKNLAAALNSLLVAPSFNRELVHESSPLRPIFKNDYGHEPTRRAIHLRGSRLHGMVFGHSAEERAISMQRVIVCVCLAAAAFGTACGSDSDGGAGAAPVESAGATGAGGSTVIGTPVLIDPDATGYVSAPLFGIQGAWYAFGDGMGPDGTAATSDCVAKGMHLASECSTVTTPTFGSFANTAGKMCTSGTAAKVINRTTGIMLCPTNLADCDLSNLTGAGIGLDLNNAGADGGMGKLPFDAVAAEIIGIQFTLEMLPLTGLRVEFPTDTTADTAAIWKPHRYTNTSPLVEGLNTILFKDAIQADFVKSRMALDASRLVSIQFHVPTSTTSSAAYSFCISGMSVLTE
jgi:hypothetical protein